MPATSSPAIITGTVTPRAAARTFVSSDGVSTATASTVAPAAASADCCFDSSCDGAQSRAAPSVAQKHSERRPARRPWERALLSIEAAQREVGRREWLVQPDAGIARSCLGGAARCPGHGRSRARERLAAHCLDALLDPGPLVQRQRPDRLDGTAWPDDRHLPNLRLAPEADHELLRVLREKARTRVDHAGDASALGLDRHPRADRIPVALVSDAGEGRPRRGRAAKSLRNNRSCGDDRGAISRTSESPSPSKSNTLKARPS